MVAPTLKSALNHYLQPTNLVEELRYRPLIRPSLSEADRAHLERWLKEVRDPVWGQLAAATRRHGKLPAFVEGPYSYFIGSALRARHFAESETDPPAMRRKRKQQREQQERADLIALADKMEEVVRHYQACRKAQHPQRVPSPSGIPLSPLLRELETKQSLEWLGRNAHRLRQLAEKKVSAGVPVHVSRGGRENAISRARLVCSCGRWSIACTIGVGSPATVSLPRSRTLHFPMQTWSRKMSVRPAGRRHGQPGGSGALNQ